MRDRDKGFLFETIIKIIMGILAIVYAEWIAARLTKEKK